MPCGVAKPAMPFPDGRRSSAMPSYFRARSPKIRSTVGADSAALQAEGRTRRSKRSRGLERSGGRGRIPDRWLGAARKTRVSQGEAKTQGCGCSRHRAKTCRSAWRTVALTFIMAMRLEARTLKRPGEPRKRRKAALKRTRMMIIIMNDVKMQLMRSMRSQGGWVGMNIINVMM